jgi:sigma-70-like protein
MQRTTLILRYGVGPVRPRSGREAARLLDVPRSRVRLLERRGVRSLAGLGRRAGCAESGLTRATLVAVYGVLADMPPAGSFGQLPASLEAGLRLASAASAALEDEGRGAVAGARESGGGEPRDSDGPPREDDVASAGPSLGAPFDEVDPSVDNPLFLVLLGIVVASFVSAVAEIRRAIR